MSETLQVAHAEILSDLHAIADAADAGGAVDSEVMRRIQERADQARERIRRRNGLLDISAELIREARDGR